MKEKVRKGPDHSREKEEGRAERDESQGWNKALRLDPKTWP